VRTALVPTSPLIGSFVTVKRHLLRSSSFFLLSTQLTSGISVIYLVKPNPHFFLYFTIPTTTHTTNTISHAYVPVWTRHEIYVLVLHSTHHVLSCARLADTLLLRESYKTLHTVHCVTLVHSELMQSYNINCTLSEAQLYSLYCHKTRCCSNPGR
jgi:hypothetical protein